MRLAREGRGPESESPWRERVVSWVRVPRSEGRMPVRDWEAKLMEVTRLLPSQLTFFHLQQSVVEDQPLGAVPKEARSLAMAAESSAYERVRKKKMKVKR